MERKKNRRAFIQGAALAVAAPLLDPAELPKRPLPRTRSKIRAWSRRGTSQRSCAPGTAST